MSDQHPAPSGTSVARSDSGATPALTVVALITAVCVIIATFAPLLSPGFDEGSDALADGGSDVVVYVFAGLAVLAFAAFFVKDKAVSAGLIGGVSATVVGYFFFVGSAVYAFVDAFGGDNVGYGAGFVVGVFAVFAAATGVVMSFRARAHGSGASSTGGWAPVGVFAAVGTTLGIMLPPNDSGQGFSERNFDFDPALVEFGWLVFVASLGVPGIVGFASRTRWGMSVAFGAWVPTAWLTLTAITGSDDFDASSALVSFDNIHPILPIAVAIQAFALVLGYQAVKQPGSAILGAVRLPAAERAGIWAPDPYRRHRVRYHDGFDWTDFVADEGIVSRDRAAHPPPPGADPGGAWAGDPYGRHRQRFFDGTHWTINVADSGGVGSTDAATYPPPAPPEPLPPPSAPPAPPAPTPPPPPAA